MNELYIIVAFLIGAAIVFALKRGEILRLRKENADLLGSLYHRVGYHPVTVAKNGSTPPTHLPEVGDTSFPPEKYDGGFPDVIEAQLAAKEASEAAYRQSLEKPKEMTREEFEELPE